MSDASNSRTIRWVLAKMSLLYAKCMCTFNRFFKSLEHKAFVFSICLSVLKIYHWWNLLNYRRDVFGIGSCNPYNKVFCDSIFTYTMNSIYYLAGFVTTKANFSYMIIWMPCKDSSQNLIFLCKDYHDQKLMISAIIFCVQLVFSDPTHTARVNCIDWSPDSSLFATGSLDQSIGVWKPTGSHSDRSLVIKGRYRNVTCLYFLTEN